MSMDRLEELKDIFRFRNGLLTCKSIKEVVDTALKTVRSRLHSQTASVFLFSKDGWLQRAGITGISGSSRNKVAITDDWFSNEAYEAGNSFTGKVVVAKAGFQFGEPHWSPDLERDEINEGSKRIYKEQLGILKSAISVPLNGSNRTFGALEVINKVDDDGNPLSGDAGVFSTDDLYWLSIIGMTLSTAITNLRRKNELMLLTEISQRLVEPWSADTYSQSIFKHPIYDYSVKRLVDELTNYKVCILRMGYSNDTLEVVAKAASVGVSWDKRRDDPRKKGETLTGHVYETGEPSIIENIAEKKRKFQNLEWIEANGLKSYACFPLKAKSKIIGTLSLFMGYVYDLVESDKEFLGNISSLIAAFTENLRLLEESYTVRGEIDEEKDRMISFARNAAFSRPVEDVLHEYKNHFFTIQRKLAESEHSSPGRRSQITKELVKWLSEQIMRIDQGFGETAYVPVNVNNMIRNVAKIFSFEQQKKKIQFTFNYYPQLPEVMGSEAEVKDIIFNLFSNAVKAIQKAERKQGEIKVSTDIVESKNIRYVQVVFEDNGIGIKNEDQPRVFQKGFTTYDGGSGMGLFIAEKIVDDYGGTISFDSTVGKGTKFCVRVPIRNKV